ncbi:putative ribosomal RNA-processing protein 14/surfeit locus protein [Helianthus annuus]|nr:putative ribosomal RNA-processing protein 14/surfeit locus protein [Helianthus annuus]KAJ0631815.1 putative ribosomal RNA-processing protein 14/surfeit locus protein [Helianthus annuus]KAJ0635717.1 putative ribosomal RNA-processing protein 14/surfeit locus protein [Helianthus annuus]KAJ0812493.1 putative ribosomal RNA-processing protein 14/surfeit locus protein [Helianthus annuus]KAJ0825575.1 putative ribosomal RNA-processing protein 14/surfeit locus protein [Helianthus annuus]
MFENRFGHDLSLQFVAFVNVRVLENGGRPSLLLIEPDLIKIEADFEFGKVKLGDEDGNRKKAKKASKLKELEKAKKLQEAKKENVVVATKHSWKAATEKAMGVKVHDDPKLLNRSLQKQKKRREKSTGKWKDRVETQEKMKEEKQAKRGGNIEERANQKKARKIAKREKKLMRPGFEGRKEGYIGEKSG